MAKRVLVVDDSSFQRTQILKTIKDSVSHIDQAKDGAEALELARSNDYDLIVTDLVMPNMDGLSFIKQLRASKQTPIVVITADIQDPVKQECLSLGVKAFINKPFKHEELLKIITQD